MASATLMANSNKFSAKYKYPLCIHYKLKKNIGYALRTSFANGFWYKIVLLFIRFCWFIWFHSYFTYTRLKTTRKYVRNTLSEF